MLKKLKKTQEQFGGSSDVIDHWLDTRQLLIVEFCKLAALDSGKAKSNLSSLPTPQELQDFCQHLVDYISEGHFKIYDMVMDKWRSTGFEATDDINTTYFKIVETTDPLLNFTDVYADVSEDDTLDNLDKDLSKIGEIIELRFEVEDELIDMIAESLAVPPGA